MKMLKKKISVMLLLTMILSFGLNGFVFAYDEVQQSPQFNYEIDIDESAISGGVVNYVVHTSNGDKTVVMELQKSTDDGVNYTKQNLTTRNFTLNDMTTAKYQLKLTSSDLEFLPHLLVNYEDSMENIINCNKECPLINGCYELDYNTACSKYIFSVSENIGNNEEEDYQIDFKGSPIYSNGTVTYANGGSIELEKDAVGGEQVYEKETLTDGYIITDSNMFDKYDELREYFPSYRLKVTLPENATLMINNQNQNPKISAGYVNLQAGDFSNNKLDVEIQTNGGNQPPSGGNGTGLDFGSDATITDGSPTYTINSESVKLDIYKKNGNDYVKQTLTAGDLRNYLLASGEEALYYVSFDNEKASLDYNGNIVDSLPDGKYQLTSNPNHNNNNINRIRLTNPGTQGGGEETFVYPIKAYFSGIANPVQVTNSPENGQQLEIPDGWTHGTITFKAVAVVDEFQGTVMPFLNQPGVTPTEITLGIEGINNREEIKNTVGVTGANTNFKAEKRDAFGEIMLDNENHPILETLSKPTTISVEEGFMEYGRAGIHLMADSNLHLAGTIRLVSNTLINVHVSAPIEMSYSFGSAFVDQAMITKEGVVPTLSIFFGNTEAVLDVTGDRVSKIEEVVGFDSSSVTRVNDTKVSINLPPVSIANKIPVTLKIKLTDGTFITRQVVVYRTAIMLQTNSHTNSVNAGYVVNKGYLYNNQAHNHEVFNAYLQVIIYRNDQVVGYKQVEVNDAALVNRLENDQSGSIETFDQENPINVYSNDIPGANKIGVFLTNGPITMDKIPSIEYGIGAGVTAEWEVE